MVQIWYESTILRLYDWIYLVMFRFRIIMLEIEMGKF